VTEVSLYRVEALATGDEGAVKLMALRRSEPTQGEKAKYVARVSAQYRVEYDAWCRNTPTVMVREQ
jgi:hypothetical protein